MRARPVRGRLRRPILASASARVMESGGLLLTGVLGGVASFGLLGLLLGPVFLAVTYILIGGIIVDPELEVDSDSGGADAPPSDPSP